MILFRFDFLANILRHEMTRGIAFGPIKSMMPDAILTPR